MTTSATASSPALHRFAMLVVAATFLLIFVGGHTTTHGAGMAFPDWPLSHGSLNPDGWWQNLLMRLEHGHRLIGATVGCLIGMLAAWIWGRRVVFFAFAGAGLASALGIFFTDGNPRTSGYFSLAGILLGVIVARTRLLPIQFTRQQGVITHLAIVAFIGVVIQGVLGGFRVTTETSGNITLATTLRVVHGCVAHLELATLVAIAALLSPRVREWTATTATAAIPRRAVWLLAVFILLQLALGATLRHNGAGLVIPTFPKAGAGWMPAQHSALTDIHFTHSRVGALAITVLVIVILVRTLRSAKNEPRLTRIGWAMLGAVVVQIGLGVHVIILTRPPMLTTLHVVTGAVLLALTVVYLVRAQHARRLLAR